jgi:hypothetical protein
MLKTIAFALALGAVTTLAVADAGALPLAQARQGTSGSDITLVREGCGAGFQFSERLGRCVKDSPRAVIHDLVRPKCGFGRHYSERFARCVRD